MAGKQGPQGIGAVSKRQREEIAASKKKKHRHNKEEQETVILPDDVDENDTLGQLNGLFKAFMNELESVGEPEVDGLVHFPLSSPKLLNGLIHECDQILRTRDQQRQNIGNDESRKEQDELPTSFYSIYSSALLFYSRYRDAKEQSKKKSSTPGSKPKETPLDYAEAALERAETGLSVFPEDQELIVLKAKCLAARASSLNNSSSAPDSFTAAKQAWDIVEPLANSPNLFPIYELLHSAFYNIEGFLKSDDSEIKKNTKSIDGKKVESLNKQIQDRCRLLAERKNIFKPSTKFMADLETSLAQPFIDVVENYISNSDDEDENDNNVVPEYVIKARDNAIPHLENAITYLSKLLPTENFDLMQQLAESYMTLGGLYNLDGKVQQEKEKYSQAIEILETIQSSGGPDMTDVIEGLREDNE